MVDYATELRIDTIWHQLTLRNFESGYWSDLVFGRVLPALLLSPFLVAKLLTAEIAIAQLGPRASAFQWANAANQALFVVYFGLAIVLFSIRLKRVAGIRQPQVVAVAFFGSFAMLLSPFLPSMPTREYLLVPSIVVSSLGLAYTVWALAHLGRSFSIMPEARRLVRDGPYALSRNPLYLGEAITGFSLLAPTASLATLVLLLAFLAAQFLRIRWEEVVLEQEFGTDFSLYRDQVPRYLPGLRRLRGHLGPRTLLLGGILVVVWAVFVGSVQDPDFWWHLRIGRWMFENRSLPPNDLFTYTVPSHPWIDHEYLTEILFWLLYRAGHETAISLGVGLVTWMGFWLIYRRTRPAGHPYVVVGMGLVMGVLAGAPIWGPRAQMITFCLTCLELGWIESYMSGRSHSLTLLPALMVLWANLHGGWIFGLVLIGVALLSQFLGWALAPSDRTQRDRLLRLALITAASSLAPLATPNGWRGVVYPILTLASNAQQSLIVEWFSPDFHHFYLKPFEVMLLALAAGMILHRPTLYHALLALTVTVTALQSVRNIALFVAATTPILIWHWSAIWHRWTASRSIRARGRRPVPASPTLTAALTAFLLLVIGLGTGARILVDLRDQGRDTRASFPVAAADYLSAHPEMGHRMYNQYGWGGYLANRFYPAPNRRVFVYGEAELMGDRLLERYQDVQTLRPDWQEVLDDCGVDYVVYNRGEALDNVLRALPDHWQLVYQDRVAVIYVRRGPPPAYNSARCP